MSTRSLPSDRNTQWYNLISQQIAKMSMVTATAWVPRGFAAPFPVKYEFDEKEFDRIAKLAKLQLDEAQEDLDDARKGEKEDDAMSDGEGTDDEGGAAVKSKE
jgi:periodic tryptophan protein 1